MNAKTWTDCPAPSADSIKGAKLGSNAAGPAEIDLSEQGLLAVARQQTGLERFGDESFLPAMRGRLDSLQSESFLNPHGRMTVMGNTLGSLRNRLWANACFEAHPEILRRKMVAPIIIVGPGRSGTTRLQRMLSADPRLQCLRAWEGINPAPRLCQPEFGKAARHEEVAILLAKRQSMNPGAAIAHPMDPDWAEEEIMLLNHSFSGLLAFGFHEYYEWFLNFDRTDAYRYMADLMKLISWSRGDAEDKPWVMKTPQYMLDLDLLMKVFPDARLVFTHRDPLKTVASTMSLMWHFAFQNTDRPCREPIRDIWLDLCEKMARRCMGVRDTLPAAQQLDVYYEEMNQDWRAVMRRIYEFSGIEFSREAEQALGTWLATSQGENRHGGHHYSYEDFGVTAAEVDARMKFYRERYAIPYEGK